jgi:hypothetical protein
VNNAIQVKAKSAITQEVGVRVDGNREDIKRFVDEQLRNYMQRCWLLNGEGSGDLRKEISTKLCLRAQRMWVHLPFLAITNRLISNYIGSAGSSHHYKLCARQVGTKCYETCSITFQRSLKTFTRSFSVNLEIPSRRLPHCRTKSEMASIWRGLPLHF